MCYIINRLVFRGDANEPAVLCTDDSTYEIKDAETSNSLLIFHELAFPEQTEKNKTSSDSSTTSSKSPDSVSNLPVIPINDAGEWAMDQGEDGGDEVLSLKDEVVVRTVSLVFFLTRQQSISHPSSPSLCINPI